MIAWPWAFYFAAKLSLHCLGRLHLHFWPNAALLLLAFPWRRRLNATALVILAGAALWYDSYFPPFLSLGRFAADNPKILSTLAALLLLFRGFFEPRLLLGLAALWLLSLAAARRFRLAPVLFAAFLLIGFNDWRRSDPRIGEGEASFYRLEKDRNVRLPKAAGGPFDIVLVHVCSLSWDDLAAAKVAAPRLLEGAAYVFTRFNSATSYSTPAALRLLRAPCGQVSEAELYERWPEGCGLMGGLRAAGFKTYSLFNHPAEAYKMRENLLRLAGLDPPASTSGIAIESVNFDQEPMLADGAVLERWWRRRAASGESRAALYFNTLTLHGGAHPAPRAWDARPPEEAYAASLEKLSGGLERLYRLIEASGRSAVVLIVPEHGRALRGSAIQGPELRELPLPRLTYVPAAVRLVGPLFARAPKGRRSGKPVSYLALAQLLAELMKDPAAASDARRLDQAVARLPETPFLSENKNWKVFEFSGRYYLYGKDRSWRLLPADAAAPSVP